MVERTREERPSRRRAEEEAGSEFEERLVRINRVSKVHAGGRTFAFGSIVVVGDGKGKVGVGLGKAGEVPDSIRKGVDAAKKSFIQVPLDGTTIPHEVEATHGASRVLLKPAAPGTGVIAGGSVRAVVEVAGVRDVLSKSLGSNNPVNVVRATIKALQMLEGEQAVVARRRRSSQTLRKPFEHGEGLVAVATKPRPKATPAAGTQPAEKKDGSGRPARRRTPRAAKTEQTGGAS